MFLLNSNVVHCFSAAVSLETITACHIKNIYRICFMVRDLKLGSACSDGALGK